MTGLPRPPIDPQRLFMVHLAAVEWNIVQTALVKLPYEAVAPIVGKIVDQLNQQAYPPEPIADPPPDQPEAERPMRVPGGAA